MEPILLRPAKAAQLADISRSVAYDLIAKGEWPAVRVGRSLRVPVGCMGGGQQASIQAF